MQFAEIDGNKRQKPQPQMHATCPECREEVFSRCGEIRRWHWAHKPGTECGAWSEPETDWHREWKNEFPDKWQEILLLDKKTEERHRADVRTIEGLVIEIQHSRIDPEERRAREAFYQNMAWIVDASRLRGDRKRILNVKEHLTQIDNSQVFEITKPDEVFPNEWLDRPVPVVLDYNGVEPVEDPKTAQWLWIIYPGRVSNRLLAEPLERNNLIVSILHNRLTPTAAKNTVARHTRNLARPTIGKRRLRRGPVRR